MLERYERYVAPAAALVDQAALERIGGRWELARRRRTGVPRSDAGRGGTTRTRWSGTPPPRDLADHYPHATLAVVDGAGHALPHEQPHLLRALVTDWLGRIGHPA